MKLLISIICLLVSLSLNAQVLAVPDQSGRITIVVNPLIDFAHDRVAIYRHVYYIEGSSYQNQLETYNFKASLVTNGSGSYVIHTFVDIYERLPNGDHLRVDRKKYYTRVSL